VFEQLQNPYIHRNAIRDPKCFFGRQQEISELLRYIANGQSVSIIGPRRIGKTSLLFYLPHAAQTATPTFDSKQRFVFLDCQQRLNASQSEIYQWVWRAMLREVEPQAGVTRSVESADTFEKGVGDLCQTGFKFTLLLDEFEAMAHNPHLDGNFFSHLRALSTMLSINYVTSSGQSLLDLQADAGANINSPFFNFFDPQRLGVLAPEEAKAFILEPVQPMQSPSHPDPIFTEPDVDFLFDLAGHHPFFLQIACYHLFDFKVSRQTWTPETRGEICEKFKGDVDDQFRYAWSQLNDNEKEALRLISLDQADQVSDPELWDELAHQSLIYNRQPFSSVFREFVMANTAAESPPAAEPPLIKRILASVRNFAERSLLRKLGDWPLLIIIIVLIFLTGLGLWGRYLVPQENLKADLDQPVAMMLDLTKPRYIAAGDQGLIRATMRNNTDGPISVNVIIDFDRTHYNVTFPNAQRSEIEFKELGPGVSQTIDLGFVVNDGLFFCILNRPCQPVRFDVIVTETNGDGSSMPARLHDHINLAPLPYLRRVLLSGGLLYAILSFLVSIPLDWVRKWLGL